MTQRYKAITPNRNYTGYAYGVRFEGGQAIFDDITVGLKPELGLSAEEIAIKMIKDLGYTVTDVEGKPINTKPEVAAKAVAQKTTEPTK